MVIPPVEVDIGTLRLLMACLPVVTESVLLLVIRLLLVLLAELKFGFLLTRLISSWSNRFVEIVSNYPDGMYCSPSFSFIGLVSASTQQLVTPISDFTFI